MGFKYNNLWSLIEDRGMTKDQFRSKIRASQTTIVKMGKNELVSLDVIDRACEVLNCTPNDILEYVPNEIKVPTSKEFYKGDIFLLSCYMHNTFAENRFSAEDTRPILILQDNDWYKETNNILAVKFCSKVTKSFKPTDIIIRSDNENNLPIDSIVSIDEIKCYKIFGILEKVGRLSQNDINRIDDLYRQLLGFKKNN